MILSVLSLVLIALAVDGVITLVMAVKVDKVIRTLQNHSRRLENHASDLADLGSESPSHQNYIRTIEKKTRKEKSKIKSKK